MRQRQFIRRGIVHERAGAATALAYIVVAFVLGFEVDRWAARLIGDRVSPMSSTSAIAILSAIASGIMAMTAIVFALILVAVQVGAAEYSPRLVHVLGRSRRLGHVQGVFSGTFIYCLLAIRTVDIAGGPGVNVSVVLIAFGWLLASVVAIVVLAPSIRQLTIEDVLSLLYQSCASAAAHVYRPPQDATRSRRARVSALPVTQTIRYVGPTKYLTGMDVRRLVDLASEADAALKVLLAVGDPVNEGDRIAIVLGGSHTVDEEAIRRALWLAHERTVDNDPTYSIRLLVDIAIRALSPAVNDPTTAVTVLDALDGLLRMLGRLPLEDDFETDSRGVVRLVREMPTWDDVVTLALEEIHQYGQDSFQVERRIAMLLRDLAEVLPEHRRAALHRFARFRSANMGPMVRRAIASDDGLGYDKQGLGHRRPSA
ncbi:MAG: DUF2254 domain-containing protein [Polyangiales bacterium]